MKVLLILFFSFASCVEKNAPQERPVTALSRSTIDRNAILGIWWSPDMFQSAAFQIKDSTIYYPESFAEYKYVLSGDSLFVYREDGYVSASLIARVTADTLILRTMGTEEIFTRSETQQHLAGQDFDCLGVAIDSPSYAVVKVLGEPDHVSKVPNHYTDPDSDVVYYYDGVLVYLNNQNRIVSFEITSIQATTARGLKVGDSREKVLQQYGKPSEEGESYVSYFELNSALGITFHFEGLRINQIHVGWHGD